MVIYLYQYMRMVYWTPLIPILQKKFANAILKEIILTYVDTLKIGPKNYEHNLTIPSSHSDIFYSFNIKIATIMLEFDRKYKIKLKP